MRELAGAGADVGEMIGLAQWRQGQQKLPIVFRLALGTRGEGRVVQVVPVRMLPRCRTRRRITESELEAYVRAPRIRPGLSAATGGILGIDWRVAKMRLVVGALVALASLSGCITLTAEQLKQVQEQNDSMMQMIA